MALTELGFNRPTYDELVELQSNRAKLLYGDDIAVSENSTLGKFIRLQCLLAADNHELAEGIYNSRYPMSANGVSLDRVCDIIGVSRNTATFAVHQIIIKGTAGAVIEMGFLVSAGDIIFHATTNYTIGTDGTVAALVECTEAGTIGNVEVGSITSIVNPVIDVESIEHVAVTKLANDTETDYELRSRIKGVNNTGSGTIEAIQAAIMRVSNVEAVYGEENTTNSTVDGLPPHNIRFYVLAPTEAGQEIAEAIFSKKAAGISTYGDTSYAVVDIGGGTHLINFSWITEANIYIRFNMTVDETFAEENEEEIKNKLVSKLSAYANGKSVTATSLYSEVYVNGVVDVTDLEVSLDGVTYGAKVDVSKGQVARTTIENIAITKY